MTSSLFILVTCYCTVFQLAFCFQLPGAREAVSDTGRPLGRRRGGPAGPLAPPPPLQPYSPRAARAPSSPRASFQHTRSVYFFSLSFFFRMCQKYEPNPTPIFRQQERVYPHFVSDCKTISHKKILSKDSCHSFQ